MIKYVKKQKKCQLKYYQMVLSAVKKTSFTKWLSVRL